MANPCKYTFNGKDWYSYDEFRALLLDNYDTLVGEKQLKGKANILKERKLQKEKESEFEKYRKEELGKNVEEQNAILKQIEDVLESGDISEEDRAILESERERIITEMLSDKAEYDLYEEDVQDTTRKMEDIYTAEDLKDFNLDDLIETYNKALNLKDSKLRTDTMKRIAYYLNETRKQELRGNDKFVESEANKKDLKWREVQFKVLSHMTQNFPELQKLSPLFDEIYFAKVSESNKMKSELEKKAKAVIKEYNSKLGIAERALNMFSSDNAKYFEYLDQDGKLATNTSGMSPAQIDFLNYMKELVSLRNKQFDEDGNEIAQDDILKIDKTFNESFKSEGLMSAISNYFGGNNLSDVQITYTNPKTNASETTSYLEAQKSLISHYNTTIPNKVIGLAKLLQIAYKAKKEGGRPAYALNYEGRLTNKFDKPRDKSLGYSKDFYRAALMYIDDYTHVKHFNKLVPIVNSLDYLYSRGYGDVLKKPNAKKWLEEWSQAQIYQSEKVTDPILDASLKFLRTLTSQVVMGFNVAAAGMNVFMGNYNNWRVSTKELLISGNKRLFGRKGLNKYGIDLIKRYDVVKSDKDSNPRFGVGSLFQKLAFSAQSFGEYQIQGSMFLGQLTEEEWDSFEYNKEGELVPKPGVDEKAIIRKFNEYKNKVSDIQGKYSEKDRMNFLRSEYGKTIGQFKVWMPAALAERFGSRYIDYKGELKEGTFTGLLGDGFKELKQQMKDKGTIKALWENKASMANLKGAAAIAFFMILKYQDDEDDNKRKKALSASNALGNLLFVLDTDQLKYMAKSPVASLGTVQKFIETFEDLAKMDSKELKKDVPKILPYSKSYTQLEKIFEEE